MRTVDLKPEHRRALLAVALRRGEKGLSGVLADVIESYLRGDVEREHRRQTLLSLSGSLSTEDGEALRRSAANLRESWR